MSEIFFVIKSSIVTIAVIFLLQIRVGGATLETHSLAWIHRSAAVDVLRGVADGAMAAARNGAEWVRNLLNNSSKKTSLFSSSEQSQSSTKASFNARATARAREKWAKEAASAVGEEVD